MGRHVSFLFSVVAVLTVLGAESRAEARPRYDDDADPVRLNGGLWLGFGGDAEFDGDDQFAGDLETTLGGQFGVDVVILRHLSLGGEARIGASKWIRTGDRTKLIDLNFKPRLRFPIGHTPLEFYFTVPVGITIPRLADGGGPPGVDGRAGWNLGVGGGLNVWITDNFGLNAEPMWLVHRFKVDTDGDPTYTLKQFSLFLNAVIAF
jgi:hypothetical protein